ncbi:MAG: HAD family hydrolase [Ruminiclostridium sp.]
MEFVLNTKQIKGIIFDMDNTLLRSKINFKQMKEEIFEFLIDVKIVSPDIFIFSETPSTLIEAAKQSSLFTLEMSEAIWKIAARYELEGMKDAVLEVGAKEMLTLLHGKYHLVILTNNAYAAAIRALRHNGIEKHFEKIIGREQVVSLKPSPFGVKHILSLYHDIPASQWLSVGDSWIDGKAAQEAEVKFISYQGDFQAMKAKGVYPHTNISTLFELSEIITCLPK